MAVYRFYTTEVHKVSYEVELDTPWDPETDYPFGDEHERSDELVDLRVDDVEEVG